MSLSFAYNRIKEQPGKEADIVIYTTEQIREITAPIAATHGVKSMSLFGSYARGEATENSDVDLLIERGAVRTAFQMGGLYADLSESLGKELDLITMDGPDRSFLSRIRRDAVHLYP